MKWAAHANEMENEGEGEGGKKCVRTKYKIDKLTASVWTKRNARQSRKQTFRSGRLVGDTPKFDEQIFAKRSILLLSSFRMHIDVRPVICSNRLRYAKFTTISSSDFAGERERRHEGREADTRSPRCYALWPHFFMRTRILSNVRCSNVVTTGMRQSLAAAARNNRKYSLFAFVSGFGHN